MIGKPATHVRGGVRSFKPILTTPKTFARNPDIAPFSFRLLEFTVLKTLKKYTVSINCS